MGLKVRVRSRKSGPPSSRVVEGFRLSYKFLTVDVFTNQRFGGNPLAVVPDARGLTTAQMQTLAREFGYSESTFVLPPANPDNDAQVRIFTPVAEMPFAGHPNVGTAFVLSTLSARAPRTLRFEEIAGLVPVTVTAQADGGVYCELTAPQALSLGEPIADTSVRELIANALSLESSDITDDNHAPCAASVGLDFMMLEVADLDALAKAALQQEPWLKVEQSTGCHAVLVYTTNTGDERVDVRARMFTILAGVIEDPATGSANSALAGLLATLDERADATFEYRIAQGVEMGRPSLLRASADKRGGEVVAVRIGGTSVLVAEGRINV